MGVFEFLIAAIVFGSTASVINKWIAAKHGYEIEEDGEKMVKIIQDDPKTAARIDSLEKRIRVLERIATDEGARLASEIEALQETREDDFSDALSAPRFKTREPS